MFSFYITIYFLFYYYYYYYLFQLPQTFVTLAVASGKISESVRNSWLLIFTISLGLNIELKSPWYRYINGNVQKQLFFSLYIFNIMEFSNTLPSISLFLTYSTVFVYSISNTCVIYYNQICRRQNSSAFHHWDLSRISVAEGKVNFDSKVNGTRNV